MTNYSLTQALELKERERARDASLLAAAGALADLARNIAGIDDHVVTYGDIRTLRDLIIEWRDAARAAIAKAEGTS